MSSYIIIPEHAEQIDAYLARRRRAKRRLPTRIFLKEFLSHYGELPPRGEPPPVIYTANGKMHRKDGPAVIYPYGGEMWAEEGLIHREDGPAMLLPSGAQLWFRHNVLHRDDAPAILWQGGTRWWLDGRELEGIQEWFAENDFPHWTQWNDNQRIHFRMRWS